MKKRENVITSCGGITADGLMPPVGLTELVFIIDRSGSMAGLESDTVGGFNAMIEKQKREEGECCVSTVLFNHESRVVHDRVKISEIAPLTEQDYTVGGCTALLDALGGAIHHIGNVHKYARAEDVPTHTVFVITTDGLENVSRRYTAEQVKRMVEERKERYGWEFLFIGANIDAVETASRYGISAERAVDYTADGEGTRIMYDVVCEAACHVRRRGKMSDGWSDRIKKGHK